MEFYGLSGLDNLIEDMGPAQVAYRTHTSDGVVLVTSQLNTNDGDPNSPNLPWGVTFELHKHSSKLLGDYLGANESLEMSAQIGDWLSRPRSFMNYEGLDK